MTRARTCETCRFWGAAASYRYNSTARFVSCCRKYAPRQSEPQGYYWPLTAATDWCGEHQHKEGEHDAG